MNEALPLFPVLLPSVPFKERHRLPHASGIYFALTHDGDVLYVGATKSIYHRWQSHHLITNLEKCSCTVIAYYVCPVIYLAETEQAMIAQFQPPLNGDAVHVYITSRGESPLPVKATIYIDDALWLAFRKACLDHKTSASKEFTRFIRQQLAQWETEKETPHEDR
jgi:hypothetical protein